MSQARSAVARRQQERIDAENALNYAMLKGNKQPTVAMLVTFKLWNRYNAVRFQ